MSIKIPENQANLENSEKEKHSVKSGKAFFKEIRSGFTAKFVTKEIRRIR